MITSKFVAVGSAVFLAGLMMDVMPMIAPTVEVEKGISADFPFESKFATVLGSKMHYVEQGSGTPIVFVHGNPTSSYLWRNVLPIVARENRAIAVDLIGMGKSAKPDLAYRLEDHVRYFDGFMKAMKLKEAILVVHDWGGPIAIDYAMRHQDQIKGVVMMETLVRPMRWSEMDFATQYMFRAFRDPIEGDQLIVKENYFIEKLLPMMAGRRLSEAEMAAYRAPYLKESDRRPIAKFPREVPIDGDPPQNEARVAGNYEMLTNSPIPLLLLRARPGAIMNDEYVASLKAGLPRMTVQDIGPGIHFIQEAQPTNIGSAISAWIAQIKRTGS